MKKKMNNTLYAINHDLNFLQHDGRPGMKWHTHKFGKWQSQAVYAQGQLNPDAKEKKSLKNIIPDAITKYRAKNDAAYAVVDSDPSKLNTEAYKRLVSGKRTAGLIGGAAGAAVGALTGGKIGSLVSKDRHHDDLIFANRAVNTRQMLVDHANERIDYNKSVGKPLEFGMERILADRQRDLADAKTELQSIHDKINKSINVSRIAGGVTGGILGAKIGSSIYKKATYNGYIKRSKGSLRGTKMSARQKQIYKDTFNEYKRRLSRETVDDYGNKY